MSLEPRIVKESFGEIEPYGVHAVAYFYGRLFAENPRLRTLFPPAMDLQHDRLFHALTTLVWSLDSPGSMTSYLSRLGRGHRRFGVRPEHFPALRSALLATLRRFSGRAWSPEAEAAWAAAFDAAAEIMIAAAERDAAQAPPWWVAEVVEHERRTHDIAVLTLRPGEPLRFAAGQHVTVQTARWPRIWRPYSVANAPRPDGLLRLHVRAVPGGWVSGTLVRHTGAGDTLLLGPALGGMTPPADPSRDLLLVAGGTGLAPLRAIIEQAVAGGRRRETHLLLAARTERDLYDLPELRRLEASSPWLHVIPVLSDAPEPGPLPKHSPPSEHGPLPVHGPLPDHGSLAEHGPPPERSPLLESGAPSGCGGVRDDGRPHGAAVAEALGRLGDWPGHEVYIAGPTGMVRAVTARLQDLGVPPERIHHDLCEAVQQEEALRRARHLPAADGDGHQPARARRNSEVVTSAG
ncbi:globin domain-containing protein [Actinomadura oligospora]|uniref:globin domain-containing protein n=1 Tax=Actinomadura oligospora TaxID=111804 RepID=UPI0007E8BB6A|nr:globin domain-containing protein [Actinomadura oligospora]